MHACATKKKMLSSSGFQRMIKRSTRAANRIHIITRICLAPPGNVISPNNYEPAVEGNLVMHKTSQVESSSILLLKPNLRIE